MSALEQMADEMAAVLRKRGERGPAAVEALVRSDAAVLDADTQAALANLILERLPDYYRQAVEAKDRTLRDVSRLLGWDEETGSQAATLADMGYEVDVDASEDEVTDAAQTALAEWPLAVDRHEVFTVLFGCGGPTVYAEVDVKDGEVTGGRYVTTAPGYAQSAGAQTVDLTSEEAQTLATAFIPELA